MPNWCVQNSVLRGPRESIQDFCEKLNSLIGKEHIKPNGFGDFWLGNVCEAFGYKYEELNEQGAALRGNIDPDANQIATLIHPEAETILFVPKSIDNGTTEIRFSVTHAWGPSDWFNDMIEEKYPECQFAWKATDEFGNFHYVCGDRELIGCGKYEIESWGDDGEERYFQEGEEQKVADYLNDWMKLKEGKITAEDIRKNEDSVYKKIAEYNDENDLETVYLSVYEEID